MWWYWILWNKRRKKLFDEVDKDYYKPIKTTSAFNNNYIEYESKGDKEKKLSPKEYLNMITPYLSNIINDHKTKLDMENRKFN